MSIYLDHAATTPMNPAAIEALSTALAIIGNPSSLHADGRAVRKYVEDARDVLAKSIGCAATEIIFTGSGTEANNIAVKGIYWQRNSEKSRPVIITSAIEHQAVLEPAQWLASHEGAQHITIPVTEDGVISLDALQLLIDEHGDSIALISVMHSNNETGVIQPVADVVEIAGDIPVHTDAIQSWNKVEFNFMELGLFAASLSGHKVGGPIGIGILVLHRGIDIPALIHGGGQEREIRSGTVNAPSIVALAAAITKSTYSSHDVAALRHSFERAITRVIPDATINGAGADRLPGISSVTIPGALNETLLLLLDGQSISCSTGAACTAGVHRPSHVLEAMGLDDDAVMSTLRFSFGSTTTQSEIDSVIAALPEVVSRARSAR
ncbi:MAG: cysteine desulfurase family protein [Candidatus Planktophila sp.]